MSGQVVRRRKRSGTPLDCLGDFALNAGGGFRKQRTHGVELLAQPLAIQGRPACLGDEACGHQADELLSYGIVLIGIASLVIGDSGAERGYVECCGGFDRLHKRRGQCRAIALVAVLREDLADLRSR